MILNKFNAGSLFCHLKALCLQLLALSLFSCSKTANSNENKAYIGVVHVAYGVGPVNISLNGDSLLPAPVSYGNFSGVQGNPYDTATAGIRDLTVFPTSPLLNGNAAFQQGTRYSLFLYDTLDPQTLGLIVFQDFQGDNINTYYRYLNFTPGYILGLILTNLTDSFTIGPSYFVGYNPQPSAYNFNPLYARTGRYRVRAFYDSASYNADSSNIKQVDSLQFDSTKVYNIFLRGFYHDTSGPDTLVLQSVRLN
jgi:Domain of unknown function (DUF4397)